MHSAGQYAWAAESTLIKVDEILPCLGRFMSPTSLAKPGRSTLGVWLSQAIVTYIVIVIVVTNHWTGLDWDRKGKTLTIIFILKIFSLVPNKN